MTLYCGVVNTHPTTRGKHNPTTRGKHNPTTRGKHNPTTRGKHNPTIDIHSPFFFPLSYYLFRPYPTILFSRLQHTIQIYLGHASITSTIIYTHLTSAIETQSADRINELLRRL
jgi:integrase